MKTLSISTPDKTVSINLDGDDMAIVVNPATDRPAAGPTDQLLDWSHTLLKGDAVTLEEAEKAVAELGAGWCLPTRAELESLLDLSRHDPAIDTEKYPNTQSRYYWTCTPCARNGAARWVVDFSGGAVGDIHRSNHACVRAVRSNPPAEDE